MTTAAQWRDRIKAWRASGASAEAFAEGKGFSGKTLRWWSSELARRGREEAKTGSATATATATAAAAAAGPKLARVVRRTRPPMAERDESVLVEVEGVRIVVRRGFDAALLRAVVEALGAGR